MNEEIHAFNQGQEDRDRKICNALARIIDSELAEAESKIWHRHPVWFIEENPIVGYSKQKKGIRLMFWSGAGFEEEDLNVRGDKFKDASIFYAALDEVDSEKIKRWLTKAKDIQWDYKNLVKRKGQLERLK
ncbi:MAG: DUF1801 domain-containing protein [Flavobacteriaceae bacterium]|nr:DUF1801 domain-containing protein [Flavobacteriaceae bacterium]